MLTPNEKMTWEEMVKKYPDAWVTVEKTKGNPSTIEEGIVKFVVSDEEMPEVWVKCRKAGFKYKMDRTTVTPFMGVVDGVNFTIDSEVILDGD